MSLTPLIPSFRLPNSTILFFSSPIMLFQLREVLFLCLSLPSHYYPRQKQGTWWLYSATTFISAGHLFAGTGWICMIHESHVDSGIRWFFYSWICTVFYAHLINEGHCLHVVKLQQTLNIQLSAVLSNNFLNLRLGPNYLLILFQHALVCVQHLLKDNRLILRVVPQAGLSSAQPFLNSKLQLLFLA